ncbi:MAG TPA: ATP-binding protein [Acidimicrobiia bacterium]|nr:ATP-binding protein [Acidimicrobiia bacterium]
MHVSQRLGEIDDLFDRLPAALYRTTAEGEILAANAATADLLGYPSVKELIARDNAAAYSHVDPLARREWKEAIEASGVVRDFQARLRRRDGTLVWVRDTARAIYDDDGSVRFYEGVLTDITAEVRAANSSAILAGVLETTADLVTVFDSDGRLRFANGAARSFLGMSEDELHSRPEFDRVVPGLAWEQAVKAVGERGWSGEVTLTDRVGRECPLWAVVTVHRGQDQGIYLAAIARDLSQVKKTQRRLEELLTAKDVFVATVSHELRNPLTGVMGLAEELRDRFDEFEDGERHDLITLIAHQAADMTSLVEDLLVAVRSDIGEVAVIPEAVDIVPQLEELVPTYGSIVWELPPTPLVAWVDPQRFKQIIRNLLSNAERHGGTSVRVSAALQGESVEVCVSDDGDGVPPEHIERIFEPYQRADGVPVKKGSVGLGLNVARRLARLMGGDLDYRHEGKWATFRLTLPATAGLRILSS